MTRERPRKRTSSGGVGSGSKAEAGLAVAGRRAVVEAIRAGGARRVLIANGATVDEVVREANRAGVPQQRVPREELDALGVARHQGVVAMVAPRRELDERALSAIAFADDAIVVVLDGITDPQNLGAAARAAEAAGAAVLVARRRRAAPVSPAAVRASAGALLHLPLARVANVSRAIERLKDRGFTVVGLDQRADRTIHDVPPPPRPAALVVGSEGEGMSRLVREGCDQLVSIPLGGRTASLNAGAALAVGLFGFVLRPAR